MSFEFVAQTLDPVNVVVWGEEAMVFLGAKILLNVNTLLHPAKVGTNL